MSVSEAARQRGTQVFQAFQDVGAMAVETDILQPAETLLDLYGETIRARAYVTQDPMRGEMMLRPDFTVPVVQMHMQDGAEPARYTYMGDVFRKQDVGSSRPSEYLQVGYEVFDRSNAAAADAEVFVRLAEVVKCLSLRAVMGDIGILTAAVSGLTTSDQRRGALMRHIWRPERFDNLLQRFSSVVSHRSVSQVDAPHIGLRGSSEIAERLDVLAADAQQTPLDPEQLSALSEISALKASAPMALAQLRLITERMPAISDAVAGFAERLDALQALGVDTSDVIFEGSYGRRSLEYYDGFVFGFYADAMPDWPPVISGGRYDALTRVLGQGRSIPAVGGVVRPELLAILEADI